jgi:ubiquinone/menaquinone biosynthesis C-methylase UbiE
MAKSEGYVSADYLRKVADIGKHIKQRSYECLEIKAGDSVLDIGCGPGIDTVAMAKLNLEACKIYGVDIDADMLKEADALAKEHGVFDRVSHYQGDVCELPFEDSMFDGIRAERLFQVLPEFLQAHEIFKEILRVLKPGGRIVVIDTDWSSASVDYPSLELERRMMTFFTRYLRPNGIAGRQIYGWFKHCNIENVVTDVFPLVQHKFSQTPFGEWLKIESVKSGLISSEEANDWCQELAMLEKLGEFYSCVNIIMVAGQKKNSL